MGVIERLKDSSGQMTIELACAMPVLLVVALMAVNALTFFGQCAVFDRVAHEAVRVHAAAPAYRQAAGQSCALIEADIRNALQVPDADISVTHSSTGADLDCYTASLSAAPTLFGRAMRTRVFGVAVPRLVHTTRYVVDSYKPGVLI